MVVNYKVIKLNNENYDYLIIGFSKDALLHVKNIAEELGLGESRFLFDLLLVHGRWRSRYIRCKYNSSKAWCPQFSVATGISNSIREVSHKYFSENDDIVRYAIVSGVVKSVRDMMKVL